MTKRKTPKAAPEMVEIKIDNQPYQVDLAVRELLGMTTQVRDVLSHAIVEWYSVYYKTAKMSDENKTFHWAELKLVDLVDKLIGSPEDTADTSTDVAEVVEEGK